MEKKWVVKEYKGYKGSRECKDGEATVDDVVRILLESRGFESEEEINKFLKPPHPSEIPLSEFGISKDTLDTAVQVVKETMERGVPIIIHGDYDVDGITAAAILWETIYRDLGYKKCLPFIPDRFEHGYGLSKASVDGIRDTVIPRYRDTEILERRNTEIPEYRDTEEGPLLITVDCGITAHEAIKYAKSLGFEVLVTDHHQKTVTDSPESAEEKSRALGAQGLSSKTPPDPPAGEAGLSPLEPDSGESAGSLPTGLTVLWTDKVCGAGIAYLLALRLAKFKVQNLKFKIAASRPLELVALATMADVQPLLGPNRSFVRYGLEELNRTSRVGLQELIKVAGIEGREVGTYEAGWVLSPRLNAAGRLGSAMDPLRLVCTANRTQAKDLAEKLNRINRERQDKTEEMVEHAVEKVQKVKRVQRIVVVSNESYHEGIIGLVAGRLVTRYYRPAVVIAEGREFSKGSARSVGGFNMIKALREIGDVLENVGGHPMAAGFTIRTDRIEEFKTRFLELGEVSIDDELLQPVLKVDCQISFSLISWDLWENVSQLAPFGNANPRPLFLSCGVRLLDATAVGNGGKHLKLKLCTICENPSSNQHESTFSAIGFNLGSWISRLCLGDTIDIVYNIAENKWNGRISLEPHIKDLRVSEELKEPLD